MSKKIISIGSDHAGFELKQAIIKHFKEQNYEFKDFGTHSEESIDYPDYGHPVAEFIEKNGGLGIVICGSGNGINMTVNKHEKNKSGTLVERRDSGIGKTAQRCKCSRTPWSIRFFRRRN